MPIRIANAPVSWGVDIIESGPRPNYEDFLDQLKRAGYEGTELGPYGYLPTEPGTLKTALDHHALTLTSAFVGLPLKEPSIDLTALRRSAALLRQVGAKHVVLADVLWPERVAVAGRVEETGVALDDESWSNVVKNVTDACGVALDYNLRPVFHHHVGTYIETHRELARLIQETPAGVCFDSGHYVYGGGDPLEAMREFETRIEYIHWKDVDPECLALARGRKLSFAEGVTQGVFCPLGDGCVPFHKLLGQLETAGYDGWIVVEQDVDTRVASVDPFESAKASRQYVSRLMSSEEPRSTV